MDGGGVLRRPRLRLGIARAGHIERADQRPQAGRFPPGRPGEGKQEDGMRSPEGTPGLQALKQEAAR